jgi:hypothetical protein
VRSRRVTALDGPPWGGIMSLCLLMGSPGTCGLYLCELQALGYLLFMGRLPSTWLAAVAAWRLCVVCAAPEGFVDCCWLLLIVRLHSIMGLARSWFHMPPGPNL